MPGAEPESGTQTESVDHVDDGGTNVASVPVRTAQFSPLSDDANSSATIPLDRFYDVSVNLWAELGKISLPLGELLKLGQGSVVRLNRPVAEPVELVAQGVRLARGEVVVVDDCFAIRITEISAGHLQQPQTPMKQ